MNSSKDINLKDEYYSSFERLSKRSQKIIINQVGGIENTLEHYLAFKSFRKFENVGTQLNKELCSFCHNLINNQPETITDVPKEIENESSEFLLTNYLFLKKNYSVRTVNILDKLEALYKKVNGHTIDDGFIYKYFIDKYDFNSIMGLGAKTADDLKDICIKIRNNPGVKNVEPSYLIKNISVFELFKNSIDINEYNTVFEDGEIHFFRLLIQYIFRVKLNKNNQTFLLKCYFENNIKDGPELAITLDITKERIRQLKIKFRDKYFPESITELKEIVPEEYRKFCDADTTKHFIIPTALDPVILDGTNYVPNAYLIEILIPILYADKYESLHWMLHGNKNRLSFKEFTGQILISKTFIEQYSFYNLIDWLDEQIYEFALEEFDYNFEVLIKRFYEEVLNTDIPKDIVKDIIFLLDERRRDNWDEIQEAINKRKHKKEKLAFIDCIYNFIKEKGEAVKTEEIVKHLHENNYEYDSVQVLFHLNKLKNQFYSIGYGHWNIKTAGSEDKTTGTIRAFVYKLLIENKDPLHISKIVREIKKERAVNERSVLTNLKVDEYKRFVFMLLLRTIIKHNTQCV